MFNVQSHWIQYPSQQNVFIVPLNHSNDMFLFWRNLLMNSTSVVDCQAWGVKQAEIKKTYVLQTYKHQTEDNYVWWRGKLHPSEDCYRIVENVTKFFFSYPPFSTAGYYFFFCVTKSRLKSNFFKEKAELYVSVGVCFFNEFVWFFLLFTSANSHLTNRLVCLLIHPSLFNQ